MAEVPLRVRVELHGKGGVSLHRLPQLLANIQRFLDMLSADTDAADGSDWTGLDFHGAEPSYTAMTVERVEAGSAADFYRAFRAIVHNSPHDRVRYATLAQFAEIADALEPSERVEFGLEEEAPDVAIAGGSARVRPPGTLEWLQLTKETVAQGTLSSETQALVKAHGSAQGILHSIFLRSRPPYFHLRELSTGNLIRCVYEHSLYQNIIQALQLENAVLHVFGLSRTDLKSRKLIDLTVDKIEVSHKLTREALERFIGCAPELLGDTPLQQFLDESRSRRNLYWVHSLSFKGADALHLASALEMGCDEYLTFDSKLLAKTIELEKLGLTVIPPRKTKGLTEAAAERARLAIARLTQRDLFDEAAESEPVPSPEDEK